jgi:hypothetical protein
LRLVVVTVLACMGSAGTRRGRPARHFGGAIRVSAEVWILGDLREGRAAEKLRPPR